MACLEAAAQEQYVPRDQELHKPSDDNPELLLGGGKPGNTLRDFTTQFMYFSGHNTAEAKKPKMLCLESACVNSLFFKKRPTWEIILGNLSRKQTTYSCLSEVSPGSLH